MTLQENFRAYLGRAYLGIGFVAATATASSGFSQTSGGVPFTPLHLYYIAPNGNDGNSGTSWSAAWATPHHPVRCGDVVVAAPGIYKKHNFGTNSWGPVSDCPSGSGGIDGRGGVYFATLLCAGPDITGCYVDGGKYEAFRVDASNWAVEGFSATQDETANSACYSATSETNDTLHHIAFVNDIASNCHYSGFNTYSWTSPGGVDQTAIVGAISYNGSPSRGGGICSSGVSIIPVDGPDASPGPHVFVAGYFGYKNINAPTGAGCNTDGEGLVFDSWACTNYTHQGVAEQNVWWQNGNSGFEVFPNCLANGDKAQVYVFSNTSYGNEQDAAHADPTADLYLNQVRPTEVDNSRYELFKNIFVPTESTIGGNFKAPVYAAGVYLNNNNIGLVSVNGNFLWQSNPGRSTSAGNPNTDASIDGARHRNSFPFGSNTYANPGLANPGSLPTTAPNCLNYINITDCMNGRYEVAADLRPSGGAVGVGYQPPGPCAPDPYFPVWLKGVVYLHWNGSSVTEENGLITKPCNM